MKTNSNTHSTLLELLGLALLAFALLGHAQRASAKLDPFYIVTGASYSSVSPRILFVLDNSGSMAMDLSYDANAKYPNTKCWWDNCEDPSAGPLQSRVHAARDVISELAQANKDKAEFGLITFGTALPPDGAQKRALPQPCEALATKGALTKGEDYRFTWVETANQPYSTQWKPITNVFGDQGIWLLCGDNRPFPYLRHDDLGGFSMPDDSLAPLPDMPLYLAESDLGAYTDPANYSRKVQWFPRFVGRRANLDCAVANEAAIVDNSMGDYDGLNNGQKMTNICGRDFYYWPYVDGDPGYSYYSAKSVDAMAHEECTDNAVCKTETDDVHRLGVARRDQWVGASLYAPFYSQAVINDNGLAPEDKGPLTLDDAWLMFDGITAQSYAGGADVSGGTPMAVALGVTENLVTLDKDGNITGPKPALAQTNAPFGHDTIASYLAFLRLAEDDELCRPMTMIIVSDGVPDPWNKQGGAKLYERLRSIRRLMGVKTYVVAFTEEVVSNPLNHERVHEIACAASGADSIPTPCAGGNTLSNWDTCANPADPANACAWLSDDQDELEEILTTIIAKAVELDLPGGSPTLASDFQLVDASQPELGQAALQTSISSWTETPAWIGHVARQACDDADPDDPQVLADYCQAALDEPVDTLELESFGPCPISRVWDAGECLQLIAPSERRIYTHDFDNIVFRIADDAGDPSADFIALVNELDNQGKIDPPLSNDGQDKSTQIAAMVDWLLGQNMPDDWKLPGLPNSAPILIRRVPKYDPSFLPTVGIRDPHCAGRRNTLADNVPPSLEAFASSAWTLSSGGGYDDHYDYSEAVLFGDDFGILHAVHYDSGNELFGFVPLALLNNSRKLSEGAIETYGQSDELEDHVFGVASTVNAGWAYDEDAGTWRHLAVFGLGPGGSELLTLDVSHMGRVQSDDPVEVVWTTATASNASDYAETLGETWSRPALTYAVPNHEMSVEPRAYLVFGSGYAEGEGGPERGRTVWAVDAISGEAVTQKALMDVPDPDTIYDLEQDYAAVSDVAVASHCMSRYWGEMQEAYWLDPAGRLFRWDLGADASNASQFDHLADSGASSWALDGQDFALAQPAFRFPACQGQGQFLCTVNPIDQGGKGDVFTYSPAVVANNRIDPINGSGGILDAGDLDQLLLALVSGSPNDDAVDGGDASDDFHSSIYLLADDHRQDVNGGFDIPANGPVTPPGASSSFMRLPLSQLERTRTIVFPNGDTQDETRSLSKSARPIRAPMIRVTGLADGGQQVADAEVYYISWTIYEPGTSACDSRWFNSDTGEWQADPGATYEITMRLVVGDDGVFDFNNGFALPADYDGFGTSGALTEPRVEQVLCEGQNCGAVLKAPRNRPCDPNVDAPPITGAISVQAGWSELDGFSPLERPL